MILEPFLRDHRLLALGVAATFVAGSLYPAATIAAPRVSGACPSLGANLAPDEARQAANDVAYGPPVSPTLTRYAMALAAAAAKATPNVPPPSFVPVVSAPTSPSASSSL